MEHTPPTDVILPPPAQLFFTPELQARLVAPFLGYLGRVARQAHEAKTLFQSVTVDRDNDVVLLKAVQECTIAREKDGPEPVRLTATMRLPLSKIRSGKLDRPEQFQHHPIQLQVQVFSWAGWSGTHNPLYGDQTFQSEAA